MWKMQYKYQPVAIIFVIDMKNEDVTIKNGL